MLAAGSIGEVHYFGQGVGIDHARAAAALTLVDEKGEEDEDKTTAMRRTWLAVMYIEGTGVVKDYPQACKLLEKAAAQQLPEAMGMLAQNVASGRGTEQSWMRARELYKRAVQLGDRATSAKERLKILEKNIANVR